MNEPPEIVIEEPTHVLTVTYADGTPNQVSWCEKPNVSRMTANGLMWDPDPTSDGYMETDFALVITTGYGGTTVIPKAGLRQWKIRSVAEHQAEVRFRKEKEAELNARIAEKEAAARQETLIQRAARGPSRRL